MEQGNDNSRSGSRKKRVSAQREERNDAIPYSFSTLRSFSACLPSYPAIVRIPLPSEGLKPPPWRPSSRRRLEINRHRPLKIRFSRDRDLVLIVFIGE